MTASDRHETTEPAPATRDKRRTGTEFRTRCLTCRWSAATITYDQAEAQRRFHETQRNAR